MQRRAAEDEVLRLEGRLCGTIPFARAVLGLRLAGQRRHVHLERSGDQPRIGREPVALAEQDQVAGHEIRGGDLELLAVAPHPRHGREVLPQRFGGPLRLDLLEEGEEGIEHDHRDDRDGQHRDPGDQRQSGGGPEEQRERVGELAEQLGGPADAGPALDQVRAVLLQPPGRLTAPEPGPSRPQVAEQVVEALLRIEVTAGLAGVGSIGAHR